MAYSALSAMAVKTFIMPLDRLMIIFQTQTSNVAIKSGKHKEMRGIIPTVKYIVENQGFLALWRGFSASLVKYVPTQALNFTVHAKLGRMFPEVDPKADPTKSLIMGLAKGSLAGISTLLVVYPMETIKTKMTTDLGRNKSDREFLGLIDCAKKVYRQGGVSSFYTAMHYSIVSTGVFRGVYFGFYNHSKTWISDSPHKLKLSLLSAQVATGVASLMVYPISTVRKNLVVQAAKSKEDSLIVSDKNFLECAKRIYREKGLRGFYAGCVISIFKSSGSSLVLVFYDLLKQKERSTTN